MHSNLSGQSKAVCYREVSATGGIYHKTFHPIADFQEKMQYVINFVPELIEKAAH